MKPSILKFTVLASLFSAPAGAQMVGMDPATGARPGHDPGVGLSYPLSPSASNISPANTRSVIAPTLPEPVVGPNATPEQLLAEARAALNAGQTGRAQQAMEMAQTRLLDRSVPVDATNIPAASPTNSAIAHALQALSAGDYGGAMQAIDAALQTVQYAAD